MTLCNNEVQIVLKFNNTALHDVIIGFKTQAQHDMTLQTQVKRG